MEGGGLGLVDELGGRRGAGRNTVLMFMMKANLGRQRRVLKNIEKNDNQKAKKG
jgi:hypothetical protein